MPTTPTTASHPPIRPDDRDRRRGLSVRPIVDHHDRATTRSAPYLVDRPVLPREASALRRTASTVAVMMCPTIEPHDRPVPGQGPALPRDSLATTRRCRHHGRGDVATTRRRPRRRPRSATASRSTLHRGPRPDSLAQHGRAGAAGGPRAGVRRARRPHEAKGPGHRPHCRAGADRYDAWRCLSIPKRSSALGGAAEASALAFTPERRAARDGDPALAARLAGSSMCRGSC